jgi:hypothetical protein
MTPFTCESGANALGRLLFASMREGSDHAHWVPVFGKQSGATDLACGSVDGDQPSRLTNRTKSSPGSQ